MEIIDSLPPIGRGAVTTIQITVLAWITATAVGLAVACAREMVGGVLESGLNGIVQLLRSVPELVALYIVYFGFAELGLTLGSLSAAVIALGVTEGGFTAEYFRSAVMTVQHRQREAAFSLGLSRYQVFREIILPQAAPVAIPPLMNSFATLTKVATLAAAVGATEMLYAARNEMTRTGDLLELSALLVVLYLILTLPLTKLVAMAERRLRSGATRSNL